VGHRLFSGHFSALALDLSSFLIWLRRPAQPKDWQMGMAANMFDFDVEASARFAGHERVWPSTR